MCTCKSPQSSCLPSAFRSQTRSLAVPPAGKIKNRISKSVFVISIRPQTFYRLTKYRSTALHYTFTSGPFIVNQFDIIFLSNMRNGRVKLLARPRLKPNHRFIQSPIITLNLTPNLNAIFLYILLTFLLKKLYSEFVVTQRP